MVHDKYKELMHLFFSDEANKEQKEELKLHLLECTSCKTEFDEYKRLMDFISKQPVRKVPDRLLDDARRNFRDRLKIETRKKSIFQSVSEKIKDFFSVNYKYVINGAVTLAAGLVLGFFLFDNPSEIQPLEITESLNSPMEESARIRNIRLIDPDPSDDKIEFMFDAVKVVKMSGNINDEEVKNLLMYAIMNGQNPGVRLNSINYLNASSGTNYDSEIKEAIISAVKYDDNPGVRREALKVLKSLPFDQDVKRSYLYVILNDTSSALRIDAINQLAEAGNKGSTLSGEEVKIFRERLLTDENDYIKFRARTVLEGQNL